MSRDPKIPDNIKRQVLAALQKQGVYPQDATIRDIDWGDVIEEHNRYADRD